MSDDGNSFDLPANAKEYVEIATFEQILEMDDGDPSKEFSRALVFGFFEQAASTFEDMDNNIDLDQLSALGHFLKGSSATLGLFKVRDACEKIQHWGAMKDETGNNDADSKDDNLEKIKDIMPQMKKDYEAVETWLKDYFGPDPDADGE